MKLKIKDCYIVHKSWNLYKFSVPFAFDLQNIKYLLKMKNYKLKTDKRLINKIISNLYVTNEVIKIDNIDEYLFLLEKNYKINETIDVSSLIESC